MYAFRFAIGALFTAAVASSHAQSAVKCNPGGTQAEMNTCAINDYTAADRRLNAQYRKAMDALTADQKEVLRSEQRTWLSQRDPGCKDEAKESEGGSIWPLEYYSCLAAVTSERTKQLRAWAPKK